MSSVKRRVVDETFFNVSRELPFRLRNEDFALAIQDVYDFLHDVNDNLLDKGLRRLEDIARPQLLSGLLSDLLTDALATHARALTANQRHNGHPDLVRTDFYPENSVMNGDWDGGVEIKCTNKKGGAVDTHGARHQHMCVFVYRVDLDSGRSAAERTSTQFTEIYLGEVREADFRSNARKTAIGTRTATLHAQGIKKLREDWVYLDRDPL